MVDSEQVTRERSIPTLIIRPARGWIPINFKDIWAYRELLFFLTWREIKVRYKQTVLGFAWAVIQPMMMMVAFTLFFGTLAKVPSENIPYPLFNYAALLPWTLFAEGAILAASSTLLRTSSGTGLLLYDLTLLLVLMTL